MSVFSTSGYCFLTLKDAFAYLCEATCIDSKLGKRRIRFLMWHIILLFYSWVKMSLLITCITFNNLHEHIFLYQLEEVCLDSPPCKMKNLDPLLPCSSASLLHLSLSISCNSTCTFWSNASCYGLMLIKNFKSHRLHLQNQGVWPPRSLWSWPFRSGGEVKEENKLTGSLQKAPRTSAHISLGRI